VFWCFGVLVFWCFGVLVFWCFGVLVFWCFGVLVFWCFFKKKAHKVIQNFFKVCQKWGRGEGAIFPIPRLDIFTRGKKKGVIKNQENRPKD
jgi:hypothetical protein